MTTTFKKNRIIKDAIVLTIGLGMGISGVYGMKADSERENNREKNREKVCIMMRNSLEQSDAICAIAPCSKEFKKYLEETREIYTQTCKE